MVSLYDLNAGMTGCKSFFLICPICRGELELEKPYRRSGRVRTGELRCSKGCAVFPIIYGVPVILPPGQRATWSQPRWVQYLQQHGREKLMEALDAGEFDVKIDESDPHVTEEELRKVRTIMSKDGWESHSKQARTSSTEGNVIAIAERLREIKNGVVVDIGCGGGFTTERVLQEIQPAVYSISLDISFECAKIVGKRAELLGMSHRSMEFCTDARHLPFADESVTAAYTRYGFDHIRGYVDALAEAYRILKKGGRLVTTETKGARSMHPRQVRLFYDEQFEVLRRLGVMPHGRDLIDNIKRTGFSIHEFFDDPKRPTYYFLVDAIKNEQKSPV